MAVQDLAHGRVTFAIKREHFEGVFRLVYREYLRKGYCFPNSSGMRISIHHTLAETVTFCLWRQQVLLGTASLIPDSPIGLPVESAYPDEIDQLRKSGRKLSEVSALALNSDVISRGILPLYFAERLRCLYHLFKPIFWYTRKILGATDLCIAMNPVHKPLYTSLHFEQFGPEKVYESVNGNPSIAMRLNLDDIDVRGKKTPGLYKLFVEKQLDLTGISQLFRWNLRDFSYFFMEQSDVLKKAKPRAIEYLSRLYPEIPIQQMVRELSFTSHDGHPRAA